MAKAKSTSSHEAKLLKAKDALENAKIMVHNAKIDFSDAKKEFLVSARAANKKVLDSIVKRGA
jgi:hypothetical protein